MNELATIERIEEIKPHPNSDKLDLARVLNYWCIVPKDTYVAGSTVAYIRPDSMLPADREWATSFLRYTNRGRCRAVRLRGEWSEGIILHLDKVLPEIGNPFFNFNYGTEVGNFLGITKFEPPVPNTAGAKRYLPLNIPRTDEERWQNLRNLEQLIGQDVVVTLKIDGQSFTAYSTPEEQGICSRSLELKMGEGFDSNWHAVERKYDILNGLRKLYPMGRLAVRGEVYGPTIQALEHNPHCRKPLNLAVYSVWDIENEEYVNWSEVSSLAESLGIPTVPVLERAVLTRELIEKYDSGLETIDGMPFEGVVVKGDGWSFKIINKHYDSRK